jgi:RNA polymerase sigma factor (sigma-70 family)
MEPITASAARLAGSSLLRLQSDERLAKLASLGNQGAFEALVRRYRRELIRSCSRILDGAAEDAVQQALLKAHQALLRNGPPERFRPWLHRIAVNAALDQLHRETDTVPLDDGFDGVERPDDAYERREQVRSTVGAISELPYNQRRALILRELEGKSHEEIAHELGLSPGAARQLIYRARNSVRSAASALTPPALLLRLLGQGAAESARPVAEVAAGGAAGGFAAKAALTAVVAGGLAGGAAVGPLDRSHGGGQPDREQAAAPQPGSGALESMRSGSGGGTSGPGGGGGDNSGPGGGEESGSSGPGSGGGGSDSGPGGGGSGDGGDSSDEGSGDFEDSGGSSGEGGDELELSNSGSGSGSSGSGSSGSGSSGSGSSGSGSSGSGSSGSGSSGSGSGSSGSGSSGSGSSGSGSSGSGSSGSGSGESELEPTSDSSGSGSDPEEPDSD